MWNINDYTIRLQNYRDRKSRVCDKELVSRYHPHIFQISPTYHPDNIQISSSRHQFLQKSSFHPDMARLLQVKTPLPNSIKTPLLEGKSRVLLEFNSSFSRVFVCWGIKLGFTRSSDIVIDFSMWTIMKSRVSLHPRQTTLEQLLRKNPKSCEGN